MESKKRELGRGNRKLSVKRPSLVQYLRIKVYCGRELKQ